LEYVLPEDVLVVVERLPEAFLVGGGRVGVRVAEEALVVPDTRAAVAVAAAVSVDVERSPLEAPGADVRRGVAAAEAPDEAAAGSLAAGQGREASGRGCGRQGVQ